ncbi:MAG: ATP-binding protein [Bilophila sp.]
MPPSVLRKLPSWLTLSPWFVMLCALLLSAFVVGVGLRNASRESAFTAKLTLEKGSALISTLEGALRTGMGFQWGDDVLQDLLEKIGAQPDIVTLAITDHSGKILMDSNPALAGTSMVSAAQLATLKPSSVAQWHERILPDGTRLFQVYKEFTVSRFERGRHGSGRHGHGFHRPRNALCNMLGAETDADAQWLIFVDYSLAPLDEAKGVDARHTLIISAVLVFLGIVGALTLFLVRGYRQSRQVVQETTAFSSEVINTLPVGIIATDADNRITSINPVACAITGLSPTEATNGTLCTLLPSVWAVLSPRLTRGVSVVEQESRCAFAPNRRVPLALSASRITTEDGQVVGNAIIMRDLGEIRRLQTELRRQDRLVALGNMAAGIAHEIRNPLSAIKGLARFFQESNPADGEEARMAKIMTQEVLRLDKVVGDLLDFARPDTLHQIHIPLDEILGRAHRMVQQDMETRHIRFVLNIPTPAPLAWFDPDRMTQVLLNLFLNALQAMADGGTLTVTAQEDDNDLILKIQDTGCGILPEKVQDIFSPYFTTKASGTGLGLSIVHKIVEAHDGDIEVQSSPEGTTFILRMRKG